MTTYKENFDYIDLLKAIAIYFVVIYHFNNMQSDFFKDDTSLPYLSYFIKSILSTSVPIFFFVNGALLLNKPDLDLRQHVYKILKIFILVVAWGAITLVALALLHSERLSFPEIIKSVWQIKQGPLGHLWFLEALVVIYIFFPIIFTAYKKNIRALYFFLACIIILSFGNTMLLMCMSIISFLTDKFTHSNIENIFWEFNAFRGIYGYSLGYFIFGGLLFSVRSKLKAKKYFIFSALAIPVAMALLFLYGILESRKSNAIWDLVWYGYDTLFTLINVVSIFILCLGYRHKNSLGKAIALIGKNSLGIYLIHTIIGNILQPYYLLINFSATILSSIIFALIILLISLAAVLALKHVPIVKYLFLV